jgi:intracellular septation protein
MILTKRLTAAFVLLAVANEVVWRTMSTDAWVKIETFGFPIALFAFLWVQIIALQKIYGRARSNRLSGAPIFLTAAAYFVLNSAFCASLLE